jgi:hypothetical protein
MLGGVVIGITPMPSHPKRGRAASSQRDFALSEIRCGNNLDKQQSQKSRVDGY